MASYIVRRLLYIIPTLFLVTVVVFCTMRFVPGDIVDEIARQAMGTIGGSFDREAIEHELGLDKPPPIQYAEWIGNIVLHGNLGESFLKKNVTVLGELKRALPVTLELGILAILIALILAIPSGVYSAIRQNSFGDLLGRSFAIMCIAVPSFWIAIMVLIYPSVWWNWSPPIPYIPITEDLGKNLIQFIIPATIMGMGMSGMTMRLTRTMMVDVLRQDYIRTAWAKGLRERTVVMKHVLKNALIPVVTLVGLYIPGVIGGAVIIEQLFVLPGVGRLALESLNARDYPIVSGVNLFLSVVIVFANLAVDLTYSYLDPRIKYR
ncbi:MAG: ABC transporter permease [Dehalococcoidales bacterium]|nr:ABC transporter permease [Dehalococcoidales bacterium]